MNFNEYKGVISKDSVLQLTDLNTHEIQYIPEYIVNEKIAKLVNEMKQMKAQHFHILEDISKSYGILAEEREKEYEKIIEQMKQKAHERLKIQKMAILKLEKEIELATTRENMLKTNENDYKEQLTIAEKQQFILIQRIKELEKKEEI